MKNNTPSFYFAVLVFFLLVFPLSCEVVLAAQGEWVIVGSEGISASRTGDASLLFNPINNQPYVGYGSDWGNHYGATVMSYNGTSWTNVGDAGFSTSGAKNLSLAFNPASAELYAAYSDSANRGKTTVKSFDGSSWNLVGSAGFTTYGGHPSLAFNPTTNEPYIAYMAGDAIVMKFNGSVWNEVGEVGFCKGESVDLVFNTFTNEPYVLCQGWHDFSVMRFDGSGWIEVGNTDFVDSSSNWFSATLAFNPLTHEPYIAYSDDANDTLQATVMKFDGTKWVEVGNSRFSEGAIYDIDIAFDLVTGEPYVAYQVPTQKVIVMKFDRTKWSSVGDASFSINRNEINSSAPKIAFNPVTDEPYVAYDNNSGVTVMKFSIGRVESQSINVTTAATKNASLGTTSPEDHSSNATTTPVEVVSKDNLLEPVKTGLSEVGSVEKNGVTQTVESVISFAKKVFIQPVTSVWNWIVSFFPSNQEKVQVVPREEEKSEQPVAMAPVGDKYPYRPTGPLGPYTSAGVLRHPGKDEQRCYMISELKSIGKLPEKDKIFLDTTSYDYYSEFGADGNGGDGHGYGCRQCASYAAWRVNEEIGYYPSWGDASDFPARAAKEGYTVSTTPRTGSLAVGGTGEGHVAWVDKVSDDKKMLTIEQYNDNTNGKGWGMYSIMEVPATQFKSYIYIK